MAAFVAVSCSDLYETHKKYLDMGEETYIGKADSVKVNGGLNRVEVKWKLNADPKINKCLISWGSDSQPVEVPVTTPNVNMSKIIDIAEGNYIFKIVVMSATGKQSLEQTVSGSSYGNAYIARLPQRAVKSIVVSTAGATISWTPEEGCVGVRLEYIADNGAAQTITIDGNAATTLIADFKPGSEFKAYTLFKPEKEAIDVIASLPATHVFPQ
jgi:hypothetical protein